MISDVGLKLWNIAFFFIAFAPIARTQQAPDPLRHVSHSATLTFVQRDGTCIDGSISEITATTITVQSHGKPLLTIGHADLVQISQGSALLFTASNSWSNVEQQAGQVYPREAFVLKLRSGKVLKGKPTRVSPDTISLKHGFVTTEYRKDQVATVDYLRLKPESDEFDYFSQEAPALLFFDPEFYYRAIGLEGRIPVRLYDGARPASEMVTNCQRK